MIMESGCKVDNYKYVVENLYFNGSFSLTYHRLVLLLFDISKYYSLYDIHMSLRNNNNVYVYSVIKPSKASMYTAV